MEPRGAPDIKHRNPPAPHLSPQRLWMYPQQVGDLRQRHHVTHG
jgi:hypothetical protein